MNFIYSVYSGTTSSVNRNYNEVHQNSSNE